MEMLKKFTEWRAEKGKPSEFNLETITEQKSESEPVQGCACVIKQGLIEPTQPIWETCDWTSISGVGKTLAERIKSYLNENEISDLEDLLAVKGVSQRIVENIKNYDLAISSS